MAKFYICRRCGNLAGMVRDSGVPMVCCGQKMEELVPNTVEASGEKHLPVVTVEDGALNVNIGSVDHPMVPEHFIGWVYVETETGGQRKVLKPGDAPNVTFCLGDDKPRGRLRILQPPRPVDDKSISGDTLPPAGRFPAGGFCMQQKKRLRPDGHRRLWWR